MGSFLIIIGLIIVGIGLLLMFNISLPFGQLPGDIIIKHGSTHFYFPIVTCLILSLLLSLLFSFFLNKS